MKGIPTELYPKKTKSFNLEIPPSLKEFLEQFKWYFSVIKNKYTDSIQIYINL